MFQKYGKLVVQVYWKSFSLFPKGIANKTGFSEFEMMITFATMLHV